MSILLIEEITVAGIEQEIRLQQNASVREIRLNLLKWGTPTGKFIIEIYQDAELIDSITTPFSTLNAEIADDYGYGFFRFVVNLPFKKTNPYSIYSIKLSASTFDSSNFYAWTKNWETDLDNLYGSGVVDGRTDEDSLKPYFFEIAQYK